MKISGSIAMSYSNNK